MNDYGYFRKVSWLLIGLLVGAAVMVLAGAIHRTESNVEELRKVQDGNQSVLKAVRDCTEPGNECFERSRRATADAISTINEVAIIAAACAAQAPDPQVRLIQACVMRELGRGDTPRN